MNPVVFFFKCLHKNMIGKLGAMLPKKVQIKARKGVISGLVKLKLIAKGIAILPSNVGIIAIIITASHKKPSKFAEKNSNIISLHFIQTRDLIC